MPKSSRSNRRKEVSKLDQSEVSWPIVRQVAGKIKDAVAGNSEEAMDRGTLTNE